MGLFKKNQSKKEVAPDLFRSITLCTVKIITDADFMAFCDYGYNNRMVIDYAISNPEDWKTIEPIPDCFAVISYCPKAGMGRFIRVTFTTWNPYSAKSLGEKFESAYKNYNNVGDFIANYAPDMIYWLLYEQFGDKPKWDII